MGCNMPDSLAASEPPLGNGFREAMEAFGVTLDRIYEACLAADDAAQGHQGRADPKALKDFRARALCARRRFDDGTRLPPRADLTPEELATLRRGGAGATGHDPPTSRADVPRPFGFTDKTKKLNKTIPTRRPRIVANSQRRS